MLHKGIKSSYCRDVICFIKTYELTTSIDVGCGHIVNGINSFSEDDFK